ncbi:helicase UvrD [Defluviimonas sp. 20V17]|uniref:DNA 3'-5' helicase n=1 Tax=Allgaiera indica TaxID=765699 RepID=A0AAN4ZX49_9RHOB|nr:double-strand break repair helicase AddA [Allgaiera indica]KDB03614.1 helicase UvrD [Defluviimonas sp. 20V17]GHD98282.1 double-strand break repair helicase AddA [Allgaiera indica]SDW50195.1 DNA helicase/exodeoxyribonuclease V, subunit A [Allgaiera indica]
MSRNAASERQVQAADPGASTWLSANAGSGKTRVLTDRVARLLLERVQPQRILCLTYTKAAASEMQNRLFRRLGEWAMLEEEALRNALTELGVEGCVDAEKLAEARRLFARAIETPGGLKIQTIHAFCASLLRRFPLEAGVTPAFAEMDDRRAALLRDEVIDTLAETRRDAIDAVARFLTDEDFSALCDEVQRQRASFTPPMSPEAVWDMFALPPGYDADAVLAEVFLGGEEDWLPGVIVALEAGSKTDAAAARKLHDLSLTRPNLRDLAILEEVLLTGASAKEPFTAKLGKFPTKATQAGLGHLLDRLEDLMRRVEAARPRRLALIAAERTAALHRFAGVFLPEYEARKAALGWLDFDDLILKTRALLTDPSVAQWVLFRLDGGIDHILVDEAQDTSPAQWEVIERLTQEFTAGEGARGVERTIFVVGDKKQSIYSFQGADLRAFDRMHDQFRSRLAGVRIALQSLTLEYSFRSSDAVLRLVDLTFDERRGIGLGGASKHLAFHETMPGRVDIWPVLEPVPEPDEGDWTDPVDLVSDRHHTAQLAQRIAAEIKRMLTEEVRIPLAHEGARLLTAGDVLILVQRRGRLFHEIIRACKSANLPIAGADRLRLGAELAVRDITALLSFLATPEDSLSLAAALRSPLFGWSEAQLYALAQPREGPFLWEVFRRNRDAFPAEAAILDDLRRQSDFLRPFELIERVLTRHGGRGRLLARLGMEAEDGIDELLGQALAYERTEVPSLTGFLGWLAADDVEVKRQPDSAGGRIRVMTVHGAKGLEAPLVILPDTADRNPPRSGSLVDLGQGALGWMTPANESPAAIEAARQDARRRQEEENQRLLYVALTRAESWLIVCAAGKVTKENAWYRMVEAGMVQAGTTECETVSPEIGKIRRFQHGDWPAPQAAVPAEPEPAVEAAPIPGWAVAPAPPAAGAARTLSPSDLGGAKALPGDGLSEEEAKRRGLRLHRLLEHLPGRPGALRAEFGRDLLAGGAEPATDLEITELLAEADAILSSPDLAALFAPGTLAEVGISADLGGRRLYGVIDRLIVTPDRVLAVDYKSNLTLPVRPEDVPEGILRQMGAYAEALSQVYPGRRIETAILWTRVARLMPLPDTLIAAALRAAGAEAGLP